MGGFETANPAALCCTFADPCNASRGGKAFLIAMLE